jgi:hypothetical protein
MNKFLMRWGIGLGAAAGVATIALIGMLALAEVQANSAQILDRGAKAAAELSSIHMQCKLRTLPGDNFSLIVPDQDFVSVELWKQYGTEPKWRIDKPERMAVMNGQSTTLYIKNINAGMKLGRPFPSAFDTEWLHEVANVSQLLTSELHAVEKPDNSINITEEMGVDGKAKSMVSIESKSGLPDGDYLKNKFFGSAETRRVYRFDKQSDRLESVQVYLLGQAGAGLIFEVNRIEYNHPIDPAVFHPTLPENVEWIAEQTPILANNEQYAAMTAEQAAREFFEACGREDWDEVAKYWPMPVQDQLKQFVGGLEVLSLGQSFKSAMGPSLFVPYKIKLSNGEVKKHNLALRNDNGAHRWMVDGGL